MASILTAKQLNTLLHIAYALPSLSREEKQHYKDVMMYSFIGADYGKDDRAVTAVVAGNFEAKWLDMKTNLVLAETDRDAKDFAEIMGWKPGQWYFVETYRTIFNFRGSTLYIIAGGREREDFGAIEGLFIQANIKVIDMEQ